MKFKLTKVNALIVSVNARAENEGKEKRPAGDLRIRADLANEMLAQFHPDLKHLLFTDQKPEGADLADQATTDEKFIRFPMIPKLSLEGEMIGATVTIHTGMSSKSDVVLALATVDTFSLQPKQGGTVTIEWRVQFHPDEKQAGKLWHMVQTNAEISIEPPFADDLVSTKGGDGAE